MDKENIEYVEGLPVVYLTLEDLEDGVNMVSFVNRPATLTKWYAFSEHVENFSIYDEEKRIVTAPIMVAETPIRRGGYFTKFSKDTIFNMRNKYFMENKIHNVNEDHDPNKIVDGVYLVESFILDDRIDMTLYPNLPKGTWLGSYYIANEKYWNEKVKSGQFTGFSLEGNFSHSFQPEKNKEKNMINKFIDKIKVLFNEEKDLANVDIKTADNRIIRVSEVNEGQKVMEITDGVESEVNDLSITLEDGTVLELENGFIVNIIPLESEMFPGHYPDKEKEDKEEEEEEKQKFANVMRTDGVAIYYEGDEFVEGLTLYLDEELTELAPEGEHFLEGGLRIVIDGEGKLELIEQVEEEMKEEKYSVEEFMELLNCRCTGGERIRIQKFEKEDGTFDLSVEKEECFESIKKAESTKLDITPDDITNMLNERAGVKEDVIEEDDFLKKLDHIEVKPKKKKDDSEEKFAAILDELKSISEKVNNLEQENTQLKTRVQKFAAEPSAEETDTTPKLTPMTKDEKLKFFSKR